MTIAITVFAVLAYLYVGCSIVILFRSAEDHGLCKPGEIVLCVVIWPLLVVLVPIMFLKGDW